MNEYLHSLRPRSSLVKNMLSYIVHLLIIFQPIISTCVPLLSIYRNAVQCLDELVQECQAGQHADEAQAQNVLDDLTGGFGKFCDDPDYFDSKCTYMHVLKY